MRTQITRPTATQLEHYLASLQQLPYNYAEVGASASIFPVGYLHSHDRFLLGQGELVWERAKKGVAEWKMFPPTWTMVYPTTPPAIGREQAVCFRQFGLWWKNACRIVYREDSAEAFGFAYGTLPTHIGSGEEYFGVERDKAGNCWFVIKAFSLPYYWGTRLFPFYMRAKQRSFIREAGIRMQQLVKQQATEPSKHPNTKTS